MSDLLVSSACICYECRYPYKSCSLDPLDFSDADDFSVLGAHCVFDGEFSFETIRDWFGVFIIE